MRNRLLKFISRLVINRPWWVLCVGLAITLVSIVYSSVFLKMNTDQDDLVSEKIEYHARYKDYLREFGDLEYLYVVVETNKHLSLAKDFTRALAKRLEKLPDIKEVTYQVSNPKLEKSFLLYLPTDQLKVIGDFLPKMERIGNISDVLGLMNGMVANVSSADTAGQRQFLETGFRFLDKLLDGLTDSAKDGRPYQPFMQQAFFGTDRAFDEDGFLLSENGKLLFILIMPEKNYKTLAVINEPLKKVRSALDDTRKEFPNVRAGLTGRPVLAADEMSVSNSDMTLATIASIIIVALIFIAYFRRPTRPIMAVFALMCGIAQTFGLTTLVIGHLNILSIVFAVILVGAGIEFGLQIVSRYREELANHRDVRTAIEVCITQTGKGNITACMTTAVSFFAACFTDFLAMQELGFIAGTGIILCLANMFTILPTLIYLRDRNKHPDRLNVTLKANLKVFGWLYKRPRGVLTAIILLTVAGGLGLRNIGFNHNLLDMQSKGLESVTYEKKILEDSAQSTWYVPFMVSKMEDVKPLAERLKKLPTVGKVETIAEAVPDNQDEKIGLIAAIRENDDSETRAVPSSQEAFTKGLEQFKANIARLEEMAFSSGETEAVEALEGISGKIDHLTQLTAGHWSRIGGFESAFIIDLKHHIDLLKDGLHPEKVSISDLPESIMRRYISPMSKRISVYAYPKDDIWDPAKMSAFIKDIRSVDPTVTGTPVEVYESSRLMEKSFRQAAIIALIAIVVIVLLDFKNWRLSLLSIMPLALGVFWLLELMGLFGIKFNLANFFGIPMLLGIGVDNAVQIVHRYVRERRIEKVSSFMLRATGLAVLLTSLTTLASFGTMIFARHQGIASLGLIMTLGTLTCFIGSMIVLPCVLIIIERSR